MSFEFIRRKEGEVSQKQEIRHSNVQISINDWGHLCIREFDDPYFEDKCQYGCEKCTEENEGKQVCEDVFTGYKCKHLKPERTDDEHLIVFDRETTEKIIRFIFSVRSTYELKQLLKSMVI